ncbi:MAG: CaiB/BaiF CoA transferase family protein, partial [Terriglobia bacterium]
DLKKPEDRAQVEKLVARADILIQNFRPGVMERLGLDYGSARKINPRLIYAEVTGYGKRGPWRDKPGQDLLVQALSGLVWLNGDADQPPTPFGLATADLAAGACLVQGILACLVRRAATGEGGLVEVSLLEAVLDYQFEVLTTHLNDGGKLPARSAVNNAHAYLGAPYGIYATVDGYLALAMGSVKKLGEILQCEALGAYSDSETWFTHRDEIKRILGGHFKSQPTAHWLSILEPADVWCSDVFTWPELLRHEAFKALDMLQNVHRNNGASLTTTRCPIRIDGEVYKSSAGAPRVGENNGEIAKEFGF